MVDKIFSAFIEFLLLKQCMVLKPARKQLQGEAGEYTDQLENTEWSRKKTHRRLPALRRGFCGFCVVGIYNSNMRHRRGADGRLGEYLKKREELLRMCGIVKRYLRIALDFNTCRINEELCA